MPEYINNDEILSSKNLIHNDLQNEEINNLISKKPDFFRKWSIYIFIIILSILVISTRFVNYPDII